MPKNYITEVHQNIEQENRAAKVEIAQKAGGMKETIVMNVFIFLSDHYMYEALPPRRWIGFTC